MVTKFIRREGTIFFRKIPQNVRDMFYLATRRRNKTMKSEFVKFMRLYVDRYNAVLLGKKDKVGDIGLLLIVEEIIKKPKRKKGKK